MGDIDAQAVVRRKKTRQNGSMRQLGKKILRSDRFQRIASAILAAGFHLTWSSSKQVADSDDHREIIGDDWPVILAMWHGQQFLAGYAAPPEQQFVSLVSRSADAEINARIIERIGHGVVRGSGGRVPDAAGKKGAISATKALCRALAEGTSVVMIADISKGKARQAGVGVVRLAKMTGRPIVPMAVATSNYHVLEKTWDKTTINLPFGRRCLKLGHPIYVSSNANEEELAAARTEVTRSLNEATKLAYQSVEKRP